MVEVVFYTDSKASFPSSMNEQAPFFSSICSFQAVFNEEKPSSTGEAQWELPFIHAFELSGHAKLGRWGKDVACAAISSAVFAYLDSIESNPQIKQQITTSGRGSLSMRLESFPMAQRLWLLGLQSALFHALNRVQKEYPKSISIQWVSENKLDCH